MPASKPEEVPAERHRAWQERRRHLGSRIRELRIQQGLTQEALGLESGLSRSQIIAVEWGKRGLLYERLGDIAEVIGVDVVDLVSGAGPPPTRRQHRGGQQPMTRSEPTSSG